MRIRACKATLLLVSAVLMGAALAVLLGNGGAVAGPPWSDAPGQWWERIYGVTAEAVGTVADGFTDGTFRPALSVTRGQFTKMAVEGLGVPKLEPAVATFLDVPRGHTFYRYIEGASAASLIGGVESASGRYFKPADNITRQQANSILGRFLSSAELKASGVIHGVSERTYLSLEEWYLWEGAFYVNGFLDRASIDSKHIAATAYLVYHGVVKGSDSGYLNPTASLTRAQAATLVLRAAAVVGSLTTPPDAPVLTSTLPAGQGDLHWSTETHPIVEGTATPFSEVYIYDTGGTQWVAAGYADSTGRVSLRVQTTLAEGIHHLVARQRSAAGLYSSMSNPLTYGVDTTAPHVSITEPVADGVFWTSEHSCAFVAAASDANSQIETSGVLMVEFLYADLDSVIPTGWDDLTPISISVGPPYEAVYPPAGLPNGHYLYAVRAVDVAGNESLLMSGGSYAPGVTQEVIVDDSLEPPPDEGVVPLGEAIEAAPTREMAPAGVDVGSTVGEAASSRRGCFLAAVCSYGRASL